MNGNAAAALARAPLGSLRPAIGGSQAGPKLPLDRSHIRLRSRRDLRAFLPPSPLLLLLLLPFLLLLLFLVCTEAERGSAGYAATVGLHPRVWRLGLHRRARRSRGRAGDGDGEPERRQSVDEVSELSAAGPPSESGLQPQKLRLLSAVAEPALSWRPSWTNSGVFF